MREGWAVLGRLGEWDGRGLSGRFVPSRCRGCGYYPLCGGRCLYAQVERDYWPEDLLDALDWVTRRTIDIVLEEIVPSVERCLEENCIDGGYLRYDPLLESTEVIP